MDRKVKKQILKALMLRRVRELGITLKERCAVLMYDSTKPKAELDTLHANAIEVSSYFGLRLWLLPIMQQVDEDKEIVVRDLEGERKAKPAQ